MRLVCQTGRLAERSERPIEIATAKQAFPVAIGDQPPNVVLDRLEQRHTCLTLVRDHGALFVQVDHAGIPVDLRRGEILHCAPPCPRVIGEPDEAQQMALSQHEQQFKFLDRVPRRLCRLDLRVFDDRQLGPRHALPLDRVVRRRCQHAKLAPYGRVGAGPVLPAVATADFASASRCHVGPALRHVHVLDQHAPEERAQVLRGVVLAHRIRDLVGVLPQVLVEAHGHGQSLASGFVQAGAFEQELAEASLRFNRIFCIQRELARSPDGCVVPVDIEPAVGSSIEPRRFRALARHSISLLSYRA